MTAASLLALLAAACGGAGHGGGIGGTGIVFGAISGFGSVIVAGVEFDSSSAIVTLNGENVEETALALGMVVTVRGQI
jgi:hypothetical protein